MFNYHSCTVQTWRVLLDYLLKINFNITLPSKPRPSHWTLSSMPPHQTLYEFPFPPWAKIPTVPDIQFGRSNRGGWNGGDGRIILKNKSSRNWLEDVDWINLAEARSRWLAVCKNWIEASGSKNCEKFLDRLRKHSLPKKCARYSIELRHLSLSPFYRVNFRAAVPSPFRLASNDRRWSSWICPTAPSV